jgi:hypothetical protein
MSNVLPDQHAARPCDGANRASTSQERGIWYRVALRESHRPISVGDAPFEAWLVVSIVLVKLERMSQGGCDMGFLDGVKTGDMCDSG